MTHCSQWTLTWNWMTYWKSHSQKWELTQPSFRFIFQPVFRNKILTKIVKGKRKCLLQEDFGINRKATLSVNQCFNMNKFKTHNEVSAMNPLPEGAYLLLKKILTETFPKKGKYPVPLINKFVQKWNIKSIRKLFSIWKKRFKTIQEHFKMHQRGTK